MTATLPVELRWTAAAERLVSAFTERFGTAPDGVWAAPAVLPLLGAREEGGGAVLLTAVDAWALVAVQRRLDGRLSVLTDDGAPAATPFLRAAAESTALQLAVRELDGASPEDAVDAPVLAACTAAPETGVAVHGPDRRPTPVELDLAGAGLTLLLLDSGQRDVTARSGVRRTAGERVGWAVGDSLETSAEQRARRHHVNEDIRVSSAVRALRTGEPRLLGCLMTTSHSSARVNLRVSSVQIEATVGAALRAGAVGARLITATSWGPVLAMVTAARADHVVTAVQDSAACLGFPSPRASRLTLSGRGRRVR